MIVDRAIYCEGVRSNGSHALEDLGEVCRAGTGVAWIGLYRPSAEEFTAVAREFGLHELAVEDAVHAHQRPNVGSCADALFMVLKTATYVEDDKLT